MVRSGLLQLALFLLLPFGVGCRDEGAERYARARARYEALLEAHTRPQAPAFDEVLADLDAVPRSSARAADAQRLAAALRLARAPVVRTPLALAPREGERPPALVAQLAACARLAELAGLDGGVGRRALEALEDCRKQAERLELALSQDDDMSDGGVR